MRDDEDEDRHEDEDKNESESEDGEDKDEDGNRKRKTVGEIASGARRRIAEKINAKALSLLQTTTIVEREIDRAILANSARRDRLTMRKGKWTVDLSRVHRVTFLALRQELNIALAASNDSGLQDRVKEQMQWVQRTLTSALPGKSKGTTSSPIRMTRKKQHIGFLTSEAREFNYNSPRKATSSSPEKSQ